MRELQAKYKQNDKKYDALAKKIEAAVATVLQTTAWTNEAGIERHFDEHPFFVLVEQLSERAKDSAGIQPDAAALLAKYPWNARLELDEGLDYGSDRPVPSNEKGFIDLETAPDPFPGFPELLTNQYLWGLHEIVGWRYRVEINKKGQLSFKGRGPKDSPLFEMALPPWEAIRVYLQGSLPDVALFAIPELTHEIHSRLAERRRSTSGERAAMDELLAFHDSKWNGFHFVTPYAKDPVAIVQTIQALNTDRSGFVYHFSPSAHLASVGDLPFVSILTLKKYAESFRQEQIDLGDIVGNTPKASPAITQFWADCAYLARYKSLIDEIVRAVLSPNLPYPTYIHYLDYPEEKNPEARELDQALDVPRKHALLLWAYVGKEPASLADFLYDELLSKEANLFPNKVSLPVSLTLLIREREKVMLEAIAARIMAERQKGSNGAISDFEREFSPYAAQVSGSGAIASEYVLNSFHVLHSQATKLVQETAYTVVAAELAAKK
jgi:hypothetical protein